MIGRKYRLSISYLYYQKAGIIGPHARTFELPLLVRFIVFSFYLSLWRAEGQFFRCVFSS